MKKGFCHCTARLPLSGKCAYGCSVWADPEHLALQERNRKANEAYRRREEAIYVTQEDLRKVRRAVRRFDPFARAARKRRMPAMQFGSGGAK